MLGSFSIIMFSTLQRYMIAKISYIYHQNHAHLLHYRSDQYFQIAFTTSVRGTDQASLHTKMFPFDILKEHDMMRDECLNVRGYTVSGFQVGTVLKYLLPL